MLWNTKYEKLFEIQFETIIFLKYIYFFRSPSRSRKISYRDGDRDRERRRDREDREDRDRVYR